MSDECKCPMCGRDERKLTDEQIHMLWLAATAWTDVSSVAYPGRVTTPRVRRFARAVEARADPTEVYKDASRQDADV